MRRVEGFIWAEWVVDKLDWKHGLAPDEVEEAFFNPPYKVRRTKGKKYLLYGRSYDGRYLFIYRFCLERETGKSNLRP